MDWETLINEEKLILTGKDVNIGLLNPRPDRNSVLTEEQLETLRAPLIFFEALKILKPEGSGEPQYSMMISSGLFSNVSPDRPNGFYVRWHTNPGFLTQNPNLARNFDEAYEYLKNSGIKGLIVERQTMDYNGKIFYFETFINPYADGLDIIEQDELIERLRGMKPEDRAPKVCYFLAFYASMLINTNFARLSFRLKDCFFGWKTGNPIMIWPKFSAVKVAYGYQTNHQILEGGIESIKPLFSKEVVLEPLIEAGILSDVPEPIRNIFRCFEHWSPKMNQTRIIVALAKGFLELNTKSRFIN